jgi:biopolymer transport protein ExbD
MSRVDRRTSLQRPGGIDMPITPMLDMTFQLLFFFILNYHPPINEGEINYNLPAHDEFQANEPLDKLSSSDPDQEDLKISSDLTVLIRTQHDGINDGLISEVRVRENSGGSETTVPSANGQLEELITFLKKRRADPLLGNRDDIFIQGDSRLKWSSMVSVMDACRKAGFPNVGFKEPGDK